MHVAIDSDVLRTHHERGDKVEGHHHGKHHGKRLEETAAPETPAAVVEIGEDSEGSEEPSAWEHGNAVSRAVAAARAAARAAGEKIGPAVSHAARIANGSLHEVADEPGPAEAGDVEGPVSVPAPLPEETTVPDGTTGVPVTAPSDTPVAETPIGQTPDEPVVDPTVAPSTEVPVEPVTGPVESEPTVDVTSSSASMHLSVFSLNLTFTSFTFGSELNVQA